MQLLNNCRKAKVTQVKISISTARCKYVSMLENSHQPATVSISSQVADWMI